MRLVRRSVTLLALVALLGACAIPAQDRPEAVGPVDLGPEASTAAHRPAGGRVEVYLLRGDRLTRVTRDDDPPADVAAAVAALLAGPTADEATSGVGTAVPPGLPPVAVEVTAGAATVRLPDGFAALGADDQILAMAQLVYTVTAVPGVWSVRLTGTRGDIPVPVESGVLVSRPVGRADYPGVAPPP